MDPATPFDVRRLRELAGDVVFSRGLGYVLDGHVHVLESTATSIRAHVRGTSSYLVVMSARKGVLQHACTCPEAGLGSWCEHGVATGLAWLSGKGPETSKSAKQAEAPLTLRDLREPLERMRHDELVALVLDHAVTDERLERKLIAAVAARTPGGSSCASLQRQIDLAVSVDDFVDWREAGAYADGVHDCVGMLKELLKRGRAAEVIELAEHALHGVEAALNSVQDDGDIEPVIAELERVHLDACRRAKPDPIALAERLFRWELEGDWGTFQGAATTYARVLGKAGLAAYRRLAEVEWANARARGPDEPAQKLCGHVLGITNIMKSLADASRDLAAWIAIVEQDLSHAWAFVQIAEKCRQRRAHDLALDWAERGARKFPEQTDPRLLDFLASEYARRRRFDDVVAVRRRGFEAQAFPEDYAALRKAAVVAKCWPTERKRALEWLRCKAERGDRTAYVRILTLEGDLDEAWAQARRGPCDENVAFELAQQREKQHPEDALPLYVARVEGAIERKHHDGYRQAAAYLMRLRALYDRLGKEAMFAGLVSDLRAAHRAKRNFIAALDDALAGKRPRPPNARRR